MCEHKTKMRKINIEQDIANDKTGNSKDFVPKLEELPTEIFSLNSDLMSWF